MIVKRPFSLAILFCAFSFALEAHIEANFDVPAGVYAFDEIDEAIADAKAKGEPISYLYGSTTSTCPLHNQDAELAMKEAKRFSVVVFLPTKEDEVYEKISPMVVSTIKSDLTGNIIPIMVTASADGLDILAFMPNSEMDQSGAFREYRQQVQLGETMELFGSKDKPELKWYLRGKGGSHFPATFVSLEGDKLQLKRTDGGFVLKRNVNEFTPAVVDYARAWNDRLKAAEERAKLELKYPMEIWTSADGRELTGRFIKLNGDDITLFLQRGSEVTFKTALLSSSSLERAKNLAAL